MEYIERLIKTVKITYIAKENALTNSILLLV